MAGETGWCSCTHARRGVFLFSAVRGGREGLPGVRPKRRLPAGNEKNFRDKIQGSTSIYSTRPHGGPSRTHGPGKPCGARACLFCEHVFRAPLCCPQGTKGGAPSAQGAEYGGKIVKKLKNAPAGTGRIPPRKQPPAPPAPRTSRASPPHGSAVRKAGKTSKRQAMPWM